MNKDSFEPQDITFLADIMAKIEAALGKSIDDSMRQTIAHRIVTLAAKGETDPEVITAHALEALQPYESELATTG